jgi:ABC-type transport system involved in multi-copper enzyme maturation permease subunit
MWFPGVGAPVMVLSPLVLLVFSAVIGMLVLFASIVFAGIRIRHSWKEAPPSARMKEFEKTFLKPVVWVGFFKRWMQRKLDKNPIGWLEQRRWSGRMTSWVWFAIIVTFYSVFLGERNFMRDYGEIEDLMAWLLCVTMSAVSAASFRRERENGVLELLLVSPLKAREIVHGRLRGLWGQFLPACLGMILLWLFTVSIFSATNHAQHVYVDYARIWFFTFSFVTIPAVGLYFSLRCRHFIAAFLLTLVINPLLPTILVSVLSYGWEAFFGYEDYSRSSYWSIRGRIYSMTFLVQVMFAAILTTSLVWRLDRRKFQLERTI